MDRTANNHREAVARILAKEFAEHPRAIERMTAGLANEVYAARLAKRDVIVRLNADGAAMRGAEDHITLFRSLGIEVPRVLAADYTRTLVPFAYQVQSRLPGQDIGRVIVDLSEGQLAAIAGEIAAIVQRLAPLPTNGRFGWTGGGGQAAYSTWLGLLNDMRRRIAERTARVVAPRYLDAFDALLARHAAYLGHVASVFYYDDMSSKNVMIHEGRFVGLVDLDTVAHGDPLEGVGRIEASWYGTAHGRAYADAVMNALTLGAEQRRMVRVYAILNRIQWLSERGVKFNANTSAVVDWEAVKADQAVIDAMLEGLDTAF
jgi:aminoglycoside phosphotransferase (APT) family kinase protein